MSTERQPKQLNALEQMIYDKYTGMRPSHPDDIYRHGTVWFNCGVQHFGVCSHLEFEDDAHADWFRRNLAQALARMIIEVNGSQ